MPRVLMLEEIEKQIHKILLGNIKPISIYGHAYPEEDVYVLLSLKAGGCFQEVARASKRKGVPYLLLAGDKIPWSKIEIIPYQAEYASRMEGLLDTERLAEKLVTLVGLGSIGSSLSIFLAQSSVGRFRLIDLDILSASNASRHACDLHHLGRYKTKAVKDLLLSRNPLAQVETFEEDFLQLDFESQLARLKGSDLVVASTDSNACQFAVNEACLHLGIPSLYVGCYERAQAGEVVFVIPGRTACFNCLMNFRSTMLANVKRKERRIPYSDQDMSGLKAEPGLAVDIGYVTSVSSAFALALLEPESRRGETLDLKRNLALLHAGIPPQGKYADIFEMPFDYLLGRPAEKPGCELCQGLNHNEMNHGATN